MSDSTKLFTPLHVGTMDLQHRMVMAPMTRLRATDDHVPSQLAVEYYSQRASAPGSLIITEAVFIADRAGGQRNVPGIWSDEQVAAWKEVTDAVHKNKSFIYLQLWALGRAAHPDVLAGKGFPFVSASDVQLSSRPSAPRPLTVPEIKEYIQLYSIAAANAVHRAGFDGVEIHNANGYLLDQFCQTVTNKRTDEYGGSVENRLRFTMEVVDVVVKAVGANKTGIRFSPWGTFQEMGMDDPVPTFSAAVTQIREKYQEFSYIHVVEPEQPGKQVGSVTHTNGFIRDLWLPRPLICTNDFERNTAIDAAETEGVLIGFARKYLANPDIVTRFKNDLPLNSPDYSTFYTGGAKGYTDYPFVSMDKAVTQM